MPYVFYYLGQLILSNLYTNVNVLLASSLCAALHIYIIFIYLYLFHPVDAVGEQKRKKLPFSWSHLDSKRSSCEATKYKETLKGEAIFFRLDQ